MVYTILLCVAVVHITQAAAFYSGGNHVIASLDWLLDMTETTTPQPTRHKQVTYV